MLQRFLAKINVTSRLATLDRVSVQSASVVQTCELLTLIQHLQPADFDNRVTDHKPNLLHPAAASITASNPPFNLQYSTLGHSTIAISIMADEETVTLISNDGFQVRFSTLHIPCRPEALTISVQFIIRKRAAFASKTIRDMLNKHSALHDLHQVITY